MAKYITLDGLSAFLGKLKDGSYRATDTGFGAVKVAGNRPSPIITVDTSATAGRSYSIELDSNGKAFVNVPWNTPKATTSVLGGFYASAVRPNEIEIEATNWGTTTHFYGVELDSTGKAFVNVPWTEGLTEIPTASSATLGGIKVVGNRPSSITTVGTSTMAGRSYGIELDLNGKAFVNVPWTSGLTEIPTASNTTLGGIKVVSARSNSVTTVGTTDTASRSYGVELDSTGKAFVNVPWTGGLTEIPTASNATLGGIKVVGNRSSSITTVGTTDTASRSYGVELDSNGKAFANVPWTDTKVTQNKTTTNARYPILLAPSAQSATTTTSSYFNPSVTINPNTGNLEGVYLEGVYIKGSGAEEGSVLTVGAGEMVYWESNNNSQDISSTTNSNITLKYNVVHNASTTYPTINLPTSTKAGKSWHSTVVLKNPTNLTIGTANGWSDSQVQNNVFWQNGDKPDFQSSYPTDTYYELLFQTYDQIYLSGSSVVPGKIFVSWSKYSK